jgi:hypothetical protein
MRSRVGKIEGITMEVFLLPLCIFGVLAAFFVSSAIRVRRAWIAAEPFQLQAFNLTEIAPLALGRIQTISTALASLGYRSIGACRYDVNDHLSRAYAVWIRHNTIVEIVIMTRRNASEPAIAVAFGEEYVDGSSIVVRNTRRIRTDDDAQVFCLPGLMDISILEKVSQAIISKYRMDRSPWIPSDAIEYKRRDLGKSCAEAVKSGNYQLQNEPICADDPVCLPHVAQFAEKARFTKSRRKGHCEGELSFAGIGLSRSYNP